MCITVANIIKEIRLVKKIIAARVMSFIRHEKFIVMVFSDLLIILQGR